ncbi:MAG: type II secretion system protein [Gemmataceae bacterium]
MTRRPGLTLTEVLVTLAILAFGVLAILTLFPLAASQMAIAVREDRSAQAANAADGYFRAYWKSEYVDKVRDGLPVIETFDQVLTDPNSGLSPPQQHGGLPAAAAGEPSYPLFIDPMGVSARGVGWMGDGSATNLPRRSLALLNAGAQQSFRVCSQMDSLGYDDNGHPLADRELRYNWSWVIQRPQNSNKFAATMSVLVYDFRPNLYAPTNGPEGVYYSAAPLVVPGSTSLNLSYTPGSPPNVKPGSWIMDVTDPSIGSNKIRHANAYQVVSITPDATGAVMYLELQTPLKKPNDPNVTGAYMGKFVVLKGVSNVYQRAPLGSD